MYFPKDAVLLKPEEIQITNSCAVCFLGFPLVSSQLVAFSQLQFASGQRMVETYRPVLPLNGRQVYYSGGQVAVLSSLVLLTSVLCSAFSLQTV